MATDTVKGVEMMVIDSGVTEATGKLFLYSISSVKGVTGFFSM